MTFDQAIEILGLVHPVTFEPLTPEELLAFLKEDVMLAARRPGSWEGANMIQVLLCHGIIKNG